MKLVPIEHPKADTPSAHSEDVRTNEHELLGHAMRHRMQEIAVFYGIQWLRKPFREESISAVWRADFKQREMDYLAGLAGANDASLHSPITK